MLAGIALMAGMLAVALVTPSSASTAQVECFGDDSVQQGQLAGNTVTSQSIIDLLHSIADPPIGAGEPFESEVAGRVDPTSVPPGVSDLNFYLEILFTQDLIDTALSAGITELDLSNIEFEIAPGAGISGPNVVGAPADRTIDLTGPIDAEEGPFTQSYDITAGIGDTVSWDLVSSQIAISLSLNGQGLAFGLSCEQVSNDPLISAFVLDNDPGAPGVPALEATTDEGVPVDVDLLAGVTEGDAPTDSGSLEIVGQPANGEVTLADGVATYTPDAGFTGEDQFAYRVCTEPFDTTAATNNVWHVTLEDPPAGPSRVAGTYNLVLDGVGTAQISGTASLAEIEAAIEAVTGAGTATVQGTSDDYTVEFNGALSGQSIDVTIDDELLDGFAFVEETVVAVAAETGVACGSNVVTVTVVGAEEETTTTTAPPPAAAQPIAATYTG